MTVHFLGLVKFIREVSEKGKVEHFIVHARKAVLNAKFSPDMNRRIPPLKYDYVYDLVKEFPHLQVGDEFNVQCSVV
jgi:tRNA-dihydrouridine synthase A